MGRSVLPASTSSGAVLNRRSATEGDSALVNEKEYKHRLAAILVADVKGYSRLMAANAQATVNALDAGRAVFRSHIGTNQGRVIDMAGDSVLAVFETANGAVSAGLAIQQQLSELNASVPENAKMQFRIGVHLGDLIEKEDGTVYGDGVNIAARLEGLADAGGIVVSDSIRNAVKGKVETDFEDLGEQQVKNIPDPIRAYRLTNSLSRAKSQALPTEIDLSLPDKPSIAVLPFTNMSGDPEQEYFTDGITEDIITELSRFHSLFVIARNSTFTYKGKAVDVRMVAKELGVRFVLEGSIRKAGNRVRVTAQLIDALTGNHIWAEKYDRQMEDIFALQEEVTREIVTAIAPEIDLAESMKLRRRPKSLSAYEMALKAWDKARQAMVTSDVLLRNQAILEAQEAIAIDAGSVLALKTIAFANYQHIFFRTAENLDASWKQGTAAAQRALELDRTDGSVYWSKGMYLAISQNPDGYPDQIEDALFHLRKAHELNPSDAYALRFLSYCETLSGNSDAAIKYSKQAIRMNPRDPTMVNSYIMMSIAYFIAKEFDEGIRWAERALSEAPRMVNAATVLTMNYVGVGKIAEAKKTLELAQKLGPEYVQARLNGFSPYWKKEHRQRQLAFLRIAAGLEDPAEAEAFR
jgi:adenylate cyclase